LYDVPFLEASLVESIDFISFFLVFFFFLAMCIRTTIRVQRCYISWVYLVSIDINVFLLSTGLQCSRVIVAGTGASHIINPVSRCFATWNGSIGERQRSTCYFNTQSCTTLIYMLPILITTVAWCTCRWIWIYASIDAEVGQGSYI
jgi:hypothetical protein